MDLDRKSCPHCNATVPIDGRICPLCGEYLRSADDVLYEFTEHTFKKEPIGSSYAWIYKSLIAIAGVPISAMVGLVACFFWLLINTGVTLGPAETAPFLLATIGIFAIAFIITMCVWFQVFGIWPFQKR